MKLATQSQIEIAQGAMHALRHAVTNAEKRAVGADAKNKLATLSLQLKVTDAALNPVRGSADYHVGVKSLVSEFDRLEKTARDLIVDLDVAARYEGPRRSAMSVAQKSRFISEHGAEQFFSLPG